MKLHTKLYLFFAGMVLLPLLVATIATSVVLKRSSTETYDGRIQSGLAAASAIFTQQAQGLAASLQASLKEIDTGALIADDGARRQAAADALLKGTGAGGLKVTDPSGRIIAVSGKEPGTGEPMVSASVRLAGPGGDWFVTAARPFDTDALDKIFHSQGIDWAFLEGDRVSGGSLRQGDIVAGLPAVTGPAQPAGARFQTFDASLGGQSIMAALVPVPPAMTDRSLSLLAAVPSGTVSAASTQALEAGLLVMAGVAVLAATLGYLLARNITRPLRKLTAATAAGIGGDLGLEVDISSRDEVGSLADSFDQMQVSIRSYITELEESRTQLLLALSYAGDILGSTTDRQRLIKTTAEAARLATGARGIWVELAAGGPEAAAASASVPAGFFEGEALLEAGRLARDLIEGRSLSHESIPFGEDTAVAYPLIHDRTALGALVAVFGPDNAPEESKKEILRSLALQAASAVENVYFGELQKRLAITDPLTGLFNFRYLGNALEREISKSSRYGRPLSVAILDLDDFKVVNDTYGHQAGDELLKAVAAVLRARVRQADMVTRYGGEEFCIVFPETTKRAALKVAEKLRRGIASIRLPGYPDVKVTVSSGIAGFPDDSGEQSELLKKADQALYEAKRSGKNRSVPFG